MPYVDGYVLPLPKKNLQTYRRMAQQAGKIWREHGALDYKECAGEDLKKTQVECTVFANDEAQARRDRGLRVHRLQVARASRPCQRESDEGPAPGRRHGG